MFRKTLVLAGLAGALTLLAACGGGSGGDDSPSGASSDSSAGHDSRVQSSEPRSDSKPGDDKATGDTRSDMCKFISASEVSSILGEEMQQGRDVLNQTSGKVSMSQCTWLVDLGDHHALASVFQRKSSESDAASTFGRGRNEYPDATDVSGLGEKAYFIPSIGHLNILDGDAWFIVSAYKGKELTSIANELTPQLMQLGELVVKKY